MLNKPAPISQTIWDQLKTHAQNVRMNTTQRQLSVEGMVFDFTRHLIDEETLKTLLALAEEAKLEEWRDKLFNGETINNTEGRAALHTKTRDIQNADTAKNLAQIKQFTESLHKNSEITDVVNLGIGGSHEGPKMVCDALKSFRNNDLLRKNALFT